MTPFEHATRRSQLARMRRQAVAALARYPFADVRRVKLLTFWENATYRVDGRLDDGTEGTWLLRLHRPGYNTRAMIRSELDWITGLADAGLDAQRPLAARDGARIVTVDAPHAPTRDVTMLRWIDGRFRHRGLTPAHTRRVGALLARLHRHAEAWTPPEGFERKAWDHTHWFAGPVRPTHPDMVGLLDEAGWSTFDEAHDRLLALQGEIGTAPDRWGLIHADLHFHNLLFAGDRALAIDWDDAGFGHFAQDIATPWTRLERLDDPAPLQRALLDGYRSVRPWPEAQVAWIDAFATLESVVVARVFEDRMDLESVRRRAPEVMAFVRDRLRAWLDANPA